MPNKRRVRKVQLGSQANWCVVDEFGDYIPVSCWAAALHIALTVDANGLLLYGRWPKNYCKAVSRA